MDSQTTHPNFGLLLQNPVNHIERKTSKKAVENLEQLILKLAETTHPNASLTPAAKAHVQNRLNRFFSQYETPDHPPYSAMIERAIQELNEKGGSSEDSISKFLQKEYNDVLPWAHTMFLRHHLGKLCQSGDIVARLRLGKRYLLAGRKSLPPSNIRKLQQEEMELEESD